MTPMRWTAMLAAVWLVLPSAAGGPISGAPAPVDPVFSADPISEGLPAEFEHKIDELYSNSKMVPVIALNAGS